MVTPAPSLALAALLAGSLLAGCATEQTTSAGDRCPEDSRSFGFSVPSGFGLSIGESGLKAAFNAIRDYFQQRPATTGEVDKAKAADLAADAAAKAAAQPMTDEQKRALRSQASEWVDTYAEKCKPR